MLNAAEVVDGDLEHLVIMDREEVLDDCQLCVVRRDLREEGVVRALDLGAALAAQDDAHIRAAGGEPVCRGDRRGGVLSLHGR